jgi:hypothetical protein
MRNIDQLVDTLLTERKLPHERLPDGGRDAWIDIVKDVVLRHPQLASRLI